MPGNWRIGRWKRRGRRLDRIFCRRRMELVTPKNPSRLTPDYHRIRFSMRPFPLVLLSLPPFRLAKILSIAWKSNNESSFARDVQGLMSFDRYRSPTKYSIFNFAISHLGSFDQPFRWTNSLCMSKKCRRTKKYVISFNARYKKNVIRVIKMAVIII